MITKLNTNYIFTFADGSECEMTLNFYRLYQLREKNKKLYDRYNAVMAQKTNDVLDMLVILYTAYNCANLENENILSEEEFMFMCGSSIQDVSNAIQALITPKKK